MGVSLLASALAFSIVAVPPSPPASPDISSPGIGTTFKAAIGVDVPSYIAPVMSAPDFDDANTWINTEEDPEMVAARIQTINAQISEFGTRIQDSLNKFNGPTQFLLNKACFFQ